MSFVDVESLIRNERDWWVRQELLTFLNESRFGRPSFEALLNLGMRVSDPDPARVAASLAFSNSIAIHRPYRDCHWAARLLLRNVGLIPYAGRPPSLIPEILSYTVKVATPYNWQRLFGPAHATAERLAILCKQRFETDIDAFVVSLDSFCDLIARQIYHHRGHRMTTPYGNAITAGAPGWFRTDFPNLMRGFAHLHRLRITSFTAHPRDLRTGALNKRIRHAQYYRLRKELLSSFAELQRVLPL
jgi:hypothetical protein